MAESQASFTMPSIIFIQDIVSGSDLSKAIASIIETDTEYSEIKYVIPYTIHGSFRPATFDSEAEYPEVEYHHCDQITLTDDDGNEITRLLTETEDRLLCSFFTDRDENKIEALCFEDAERYGAYCD